MKGYSVTFSDSRSQKSYLEISLLHCAPGTACAPAQLAPANCQTRGASAVTSAAGLSSHQLCRDAAAQGL